MKMDERRESRSNQTTRAAAVLPNTKTNTNMHTYTHVHTVYSLVSSTQIETAFSFGWMSRTALVWITDVLKGWYKKYDGRSV